MADDSAAELASQSNQGDAVSILDESTPAGIDVKEVSEREDSTETTSKALAAEEEHDFESGDDEEARIKTLDAVARDQDDLERDVGRQADQMLLEQADERDQKRLDKTLAQKQRLLTQVRDLESKLHRPSTSATSTRIRSEIEHLQPQIALLDRDLEQIQKRMEERHQAPEDGENALVSTEETANMRRPGESRRDFLIRTGKITPFSKIGIGIQNQSSNLGDVMLDAEEGDEEDLAEDLEEQVIRNKPLSHRDLLRPGYKDDDSSQTESTAESIDDRPRKKRRVLPSSRLANSEPASSDVASEYESAPLDGANLSYAEKDSSSDSFGVVGEGTDERMGSAKRKKPRDRPRHSHDADDLLDLAGVDDGNEKLYKARLDNWSRGRKEARQRAREKTKASLGRDMTEAELADEAVDDADDNLNKEWLRPHPSRPDTELDNGLRIPGDIYSSLFDYQKTGVQWLWELYSQKVGGIVGDEMGLGKTIQIIALLAALHHSGRQFSPVIVVCPATVMKQWVNEFHRWWPPLRVSILHSSGSGMMNVRRERDFEDELEARSYQRTSLTHGRGHKTAKKIVDRVLNDGHVLVTTYSGLQTYAELLIPVEWGYAVLDEGHKIRNPNAGITIFCKELRTWNRVILSGTPMQNNLTELWSLFDFVFPMRLGTLVNFRNQFEIPIKQGGYANASNLQVETALKCAETLKDAISPYLLQRFKVDVAADLPKKSEQVLFCRLTKVQRDCYEEFLGSNEMKSIMEGRRQVLYGIDILRKICNHPDLRDHRVLSVKADYKYGVGSKSGKMQVVKALLQLWKDTGHKTLLFTQHKIMLDIMERFIGSLGGFNYCRMDGTTAIKDRQDMVDEFNRNSNLHVFLLTTKVGGLGVNLTGADRVIIYDPDWNPSTDVQARERAWRLGQKREVMIYRLMTAGTIEEKIYHRQIFKQFLTNKILRDPKQRQTFKLSDLHDLFTLGDANDQQTETGGLFKNTQVKFPSGQAHHDQNGAEPHSTAQPDAGDGANIDEITGVAHRETLQTSENPGQDSSQATNGEARSSPARNSDSRLLSTIFARADIHSAYEHDAIIQGTGNEKPGVIRADPEIIAQEAKRAAKAAAKELQRAQEAARDVPAGTPTWTGVVGVAGRPDPPSSRGGFMGLRGGRGGHGAGGPSSSDVLANLAARQQRGAPNNEQLPSGKTFLAMIRDYLQSHGGAVYTQMLVDHFNRYCGTPERTAEFREMLKTIAVLDKGVGTARGRGIGRRGRGGRGRWILKKEFGGTAE